jgi:hypothetical protein
VAEAAFWYSDLLPTGADDAPYRLVTTVECVFESWEDSADYPTLFRVDREVCIDVARVVPGASIRKDELPLWLEIGRLASGAIDAGTPNRLDPQIDGGWVAAVEMPARSANGRSRLTMQLWLPPDALT